MSLRLVGVTKRYGAHAALDRVSMHVRAGEIYGFIGHNGAGKTTAMRVALGLVHADEGAVLVDGFDAARHPREARARMGALVETAGFHGAWSGARNLEELARLQGLARGAARREAGAWLERVGLAPAASKPVQAYSQGMRQRLGIAQALLGSPRIVLLDEPTNGLDPEGIAEIRELLRAQNRERGATVLVSSHQLHELSGLCHRIGVLRAGRLVAESETARLLSGSGRYRIEADDPARAARALAELGLAAAKQQGALAVDLGVRPAAPVAAALVGSGAGLRAFAPAPQVLEEIYLRLSDGDLPPAVAEDEPAAPAPPRERLAPSAPAARVLVSDLRRWSSTPAVPLLLLTPAAFGLLSIARRASQAAQDVRSVEGSTLFSATDVNGFEAVGLALQAGLPVLAFVALGLASQSLAAELSRGTLRNLLLRPLTRAQAALGKLGALLACVLGSYALLAGSALLAAALAFGFQDVSEVLPNGQRFPLVAAAELWPTLRLALLAPILPLCAYAALGFACSALARAGAAALAFALGAGVLLDLGRTFARAGGLRGALPSDHLPSPLSDTSFVRFYVDVSQGISNARFDGGHLALVVPLGWAVACAALGAVALVRRDVP